MSDIIFTSAMMSMDSHKSSFRVKLPPEGLSLEDVEKELVSQALSVTGGNKSRAAKLLAITRDQIRYKIEKHGLEKEDKLQSATSV